MWKEVPTEKIVVELTDKDGAPVGFQVFSDRDQAVTWIKEVLSDDKHKAIGMRGFIRKWEGVELVWVDNDN
jgi:hypothetical protein